MSERTSDYYVSPLQVDCTAEEMRLHGPARGNGGSVTIKRLAGGLEVTSRSGPTVSSICWLSGGTVRRMAGWMLDKTGDES